MGSLNIGDRVEVTQDLTTKCFRIGSRGIILGKVGSSYLVDFYEGEYLTRETGSSAWLVHHKDLKLVDLGGYSRCTGKGE